MQETKQKEIREKWDKEYHRPEGFVVEPEQTRLNTDRIADWWLSEFSTLLQEERENTIEKIKKIKAPKFDTETSRSDVYYQAIDDIINQLENK